MYGSVDGVAKTSQDIVSLMSSTTGRGWYNNRRILIPQNIQTKKALLLVLRDMYKLAMVYINEFEQRKHTGEIHAAKLFGVEMLAEPTLPEDGKFIVRSQNYLNETILNMFIGQAESVTAFIIQIMDPGNSYFTREKVIRIKHVLKFAGIVDDMLDSIDANETTEPVTSSVRTDQLSNDPF